MLREQWRALCFKDARQGFGLHHPAGICHAVVPDSAWVRQRGKSVRSISPGGRYPSRGTVPAAVMERVPKASALNLSSGQTGSPCFRPFPFHSPARPVRTTIANTFLPVSLWRHSAWQLRRPGLSLIGRTCLGPLIAGAGFGTGLQPSAVGLISCCCWLGVGGFGPLHQLTVCFYALAGAAFGLPVGLVGGQLPGRKLSRPWLFFAARSADSFAQPPPGGAARTL